MSKHMIDQYIEGRETPNKKVGPIKLDYSQVEDVQVYGIDYADSPKFVDAYIVSATYMGRDMTDDELDVLNEDSNYVYEAVQRALY